MRLTSRVHVDRSRDAAWAALVDFDHYEVLLAERVPDLARVGPTPDWTASVTIRGVAKPAAFHVAEVQPPRRLVLTGEIGTLDLMAGFDLDDAGAEGTGLTVDLSIRAKGLRAKALLKSLTLTRGAIQDRFAKRLDWLARDIERRTA